MIELSQKLLSIWMGVVILSLSIGLSNMELKTHYFQWGPHDDFMVFGISINTYTKYSCITLYSFINSGMRAIHHTIIQPWILHHVQDKTINHKTRPKDAYSITILSTLYNWFDWFIYMNILLSQIDMLIIELIADLCMTGITTRYYLQEEPLIVKESVFSA